MTYLPDLRDSLVKAAREQAAAGPGTAPARRRFSFGGVLTLVAATGAVAVAVIALAVVGHGHPTRATAPSSHQPATLTHKQAVAHAAAARILSQVVLPPGAVEVKLARGVSAALWTPADKLPIPGHADVYKLWRVPGGPQQVINFLQAHGVAGAESGGVSESGISRGKGGPTVVDDATATILFPVGPHTALVRELAVHIVRTGGAGSLVRMDAQAGWIVPRSPAERIPVGADRLVVTTLVPRKGQPPTRHMFTITSRARIKQLVALLNRLPLAQPGVSQCVGSSGPRSQFSFYSAGSATPIAGAVFLASCFRIELTIGGRPQPALALSATDALTAAGSDVKQLLSFTVSG